VVRIGGSSARRVSFRKVEPIYPTSPSPRAERHRRPGSRVDTRGYREVAEGAERASVCSTTCLEAVRQWRYQPLLLNGEPTGFILSV
jgi:hypothetical protein